MISFNQVCKTFETSKPNLLEKVQGKKVESIKANDHVSFKCEEGKITGLLGINGAGKSTALKMLAGLLPLDEGAINVGEYSISDNKIKALNNMGIFLDSSGLYPKLTARENIELFAGIQGVDDPKQAAQHWIDHLKINDLADRKVEGFSTGQRMKTALARSIAHKPNYIIMDEPTRGLDIMTIRLLRETLLDLKDQGCGILFSTHVMQEVDRLCDHVVVIHDGKILAEGTVEEIRQLGNHNDLEEAFMNIVNGQVSKQASTSGTDADQYEPSQLAQGL